MNNDKKLSRRQLMEASVAMAGVTYLSPLELMVSSILDGLVAKAHAQTLGIQARNYVFMQLPGGPPRWTWCPFTPFDDYRNLATNINVGTRYISTSQIQYITKNINGINMPWLWQYDVAKAGGGERPMSELMDDTLFMRGVDCGNPAHTGAQALQFLPQGASSTFTAFSADQNPNPIAHIDMGTSRSIWKSSNNKTRVNLPTNSSMLKSLLSPFIGISSSNFQANKNKIDQAIKSSMASLSESTASDHPGASAIISSQKDATDLMRRSFNDLDKEFSDRVNKYEDLVRRSKDTFSNLPGITDANAGGMRDAYKNSQFRNLSRYFAVTEYVLVNGYSSSLSFRVRGITPFDEHDLDPLKSLMGNSMLNRVLAACILELKDTLAAKGIWDETLINLSGEFGRYSRSNGEKGSHHAPQGGTISLIGGALKGREVIGNIKASRAWGEKAPNTDKEGKSFGHLGQGHLANTISTILRTPHLFTAVPSLVKEVNGKFESILPGGRLK